jgi:hypothetical protein
MKIMYTKKKDKHCYEVEGAEGWFARPVHTSDQASKLKDGWTYTNPIKAEPKEEAEEPEPEKDWKEQAKELGIALSVEGKKVHPNTVKKQISEALEAKADEEGQAG